MPGMRVRGWIPFHVQTAGGEAGLAADLSFLPQAVRHRVDRKPGPTVILMDTMRPSTHMCNLPPWEIASRAYNENSAPLSIQGVRVTHAHFFAILDRLDT